MFSIRKFIPQTLFARFVLIIIIPILIGQIVAVFLFYDRHWYNVSYYTSNIIAKEIVELIKLHNDDLLENKKEGEYLNLLYKFEENLHLPTKQPKISEELGIFKNILNVKVNKDNIVRLGKSGKIEVLFPFNDKLMIISFPAKILLNPTVYIFVLWIIFLTILLLTISLLFSKNQIRSILELANAADEFGKNIQNKKIFKPTGALEIRKAGLAFLKMKYRIERQIEKRTTMLAMISHDLRTPLTRMKLQLELMNKSQETIELQQDITIMQEMITSYLDFSNGKDGEKLQKVSALNWFTTFTNKWPNIKIELFIKDNIKLKIKPNSFERVFSNLLSNAAKYSTKVKISIYQNSKNILIELEDNGPGIKNSEKHLVFQPFYRSDRSRHMDSSSNVGLGLAIVREIILDHQGTIKLGNSTSLGGLLVKIELPKIENE